MPMRRTDAGAVHSLRSNDAAGPQEGRVVLFLQGPPGAFFRRLAEHLESLGATCIKVRLNPGDFFDTLGQRAVSYRGSFTAWPDWLRRFGTERGVTDLVFYGDCRPYHKVAADVLRRQGVRVHVFEEGYLRPRWITYERDGVNGNSKLISLPLSRIDKKALEGVRTPDDTSVGDPMWPYIWKGLRYYAYNFFFCFLYPFYRGHRSQGLIEEAWYWTFRWPILPRVKRRARARARAVLNAAKPIHLVLLQLNGDFQLREHSPFNSVTEFIELCIKTYAEAGIRDEPLVFKNHPLDIGHLNLDRFVRETARAHGVEDQCVFIDGGKLAKLLDLTKSVVAVNTTSCQQTIGRGIPTKVLGTAIYNHTGLTSDQTLQAFFQDPQPPDPELYGLFRRLLLVTSQINGNFSTAKGIDMTLEPLGRKMLAEAEEFGEFILAETNPDLKEVVATSAAE